MVKVLTILSFVIIIGSVNCNAQPNDVRCIQIQNLLFSNGTAMRELMIARDNEFASHGYSLRWQDVNYQIEQLIKQISRLLEAWIVLDCDQLLKPQPFTPGPARGGGRGSGPTATGRAMLDAMASILP